MKSRFTRRSALQLLGMGAAASLLPGRLIGRARAAANIPTRIVLFYTNHGSYRPAWLPVGAGGSGTPTETAYDFGAIHQPLAAFKKDILLIDGLDMLSSDQQTTPASNAHIMGHCHSLVATEMADANLAGGISIDQQIAHDLNTPTPATALPSLEIGVYPNSESRISFSGPSQQLPIESSPANAFKRLFPNGVAPGMGMDDGSAARQKSVLDFVAADFAALATKLGKDNRTKLQTHADAVRDMETRLSLSPTRSCTVPQLAAASKYADNDPTYYQATADSFMRLIAAAFACDLTRVVTFSPEQIPDAMCGYTSNAFGTTDLHDLIHKVAQPSDPLSKNADAIAIITNYHVQYATQFAKLLNYLAMMPESDGSSLLSHTIVLWCGEIAEGNHDLHHLPWLIAGQGSGAIRTGRYLQVPRSPTPRGHNDLFVSLANAMGSTITTFGDPSVCKGALDGLS